MTRPIELWAKEDRHAAGERDEWRLATTADIAAKLAAMPTEEREAVLDAYWDATRCYPSTPVHSHRGIVLKKDNLGYGSIEDRVYVHLDGEEWYASVGIGDNDESIAYGATMRQAVDAALDQADKEITGAIRSFTAERAKIRRIRRTAP